MTFSNLWIIWEIILVLILGACAYAASAGFEGANAVFTAGVFLLYTLCFLAHSNLRFFLLLVGLAGVFWAGPEEVGYYYWKYQNPRPLWHFVADKYKEQGVSYYAADLLPGGGKERCIFSWRKENHYYLTDLVIERGRWTLFTSRIYGRQPNETFFTLYRSPGGRLVIIAYEPLFWNAPEAMPARRPGVWLFVLNRRGEVSIKPLVTNYLSLFLRSGGAVSVNF